MDNHLWLCKSPQWSFITAAVMNKPLSHVQQNLLNREFKSMICTRKGMLVYLVVEVVESDPILGQHVVETLREVPHAQLVPAIRTTITNKINLLQVSVYGIGYKVKATVKPMSRSFKGIRLIPTSIVTASI